MFNAENSDVLKTSGIGLGLTTAKQLTQALQGAVSIESVKYQGTRVTFSVLSKLPPEKILAHRLQALLRLEQQKSVFSVPAHHFSELGLTFDD